MAELEHHHGARLPEDYRAFITKLGNGGPGPYYGVMPLEESLAWIDSDSSPSPLAAACPMRPEEDYWAAWDACKEEEGLLPVIHLGCGEHFWIVVSGDSRGRVIYAGTGRPAFFDDSCFVDFYLRWLEVPFERFGVRWERTEEETLQRVSTLDPEPILVHALDDLKRMALSSRSLDLAREAAMHGRQRVRAAAASVLAKLEAWADLFPLLRDQEPTVRESAARGVELSPANDAREALISALARETNANTYWTIANILKQRGELTAEHLQAGARSTDLVFRTNATYFLSGLRGR